MDNCSVDTHGHCFVCLVKLEQVVPCFLHPLQYLCTYLNLDLDKVFNNDEVDAAAAGQGERSSRFVQVPLCEGCEPLNGSLSELYIQLQKIRGEMASRLFRLHQKMTSADETGLGELFRTLMGGDNVVEKLRKETILKCSLKLNAFSPQVDIQKLTKNKKKPTAQNRKPTRGRPRKLKSPVMEPTTVKMEPSTEAIIPDWDDDAEDMNYDDPDYLPEPDHSPSQEEEEEVLKHDPDPLLQVKTPFTIIKRKGRPAKPRLQNSTLLPSTGGRKCNLCSEEFVSGPSFLYHYRKVHLQLRYPCTSCEKEFNSRCDLTRHYRNRHMGVKFKCHICSKSFSLKTNLRLHQRLKQCRRGEEDVEESYKERSAVRRGRGRPRKQAVKKESDSDSETAGEGEGKSSAEASIPPPSVSQEEGGGAPQTILHSNTGKYECFICSKEFKKESTFQDHYKSVHLKQRFSCNSCTKSFGYLRAYMLHYRTKHLTRVGDNNEPEYLPAEAKEPQPLSEEDEDQEEKEMKSQRTILFGGGGEENRDNSSTTTTKPMLENSTLISEEGRRRCNDCSAEFVSGPVFLSHYKRSHLHIRVKCNVCGDHFADNGTFYRHYRNLHLGVKFRCSTCSKLFSLKCLLRRHQRTECSSSRGEGGEKAEPRKRKYVRRKRDNKAIPQSASESTPLEIVVEPKSPNENPEAARLQRENREVVEVTIGDSNLQKGRTVPSPTILQDEGGAELGPVESIFNPETGRYGCRLCGKDFKLDRVFQDHYKSIHLKLRFKCNACDKSFGYLQAYNGHYRHVHVRINYNCRICHTKFLRRANLWRHQQEGNCGDPLGHQCPQCGKSYATGIKLRKHIKAVHVKQHHVCDRCGKEFNTAPYLNKHIRTQHPDGERKMLDCPHCEKRFPKLDNLRLHLRTHTGEKPYQCGHCGKAFSSGSNRNLHQKSCTRGQQQQQPPPQNPNMFNYY